MSRLLDKLIASRAVERVMNSWWTVGIVVAIWLGSLVVLVTGGLAR